MAIATYVIKTRTDETTTSTTDAGAESARALVQAELGTTTGLWLCVIGGTSTSAAGDVAGGSTTDDTGGNGAAES
jgi:hypothetical protein